MSAHSMIRGGFLSPIAAASSLSPRAAASRRISGVRRTKCALVISRSADTVSRSRAALS